MNPVQRLKCLKDTHLHGVASAAREGNTQEVVRKSRFLEEIQRLEGKLAEIDQAIRQLEGTSAASNQLSTGGDLAVISDGRYEREVDHGTARMRGESWRRRFIRNAADKNIVLTQIRGILYRNEKGGLVALGYAGNQKYPNRWWIGIPERSDYASVALLLEDDDGSVLEFMFPRDSCRAWIPKLHPSNGQIKINVHRQAGRYYLEVPSGDNIHIDSFRNAYEHLASTPQCISGAK